MPASTPFIIYMNFVVASIGLYGEDWMREMTRKYILPSRNLYLLQQKLLNRLLRPNSLWWFGWTLEFTNEKQNQKWSKGHMCMGGISCNEKWELRAGKICRKWRKTCKKMERTKKHLPQPEESNRDLDWERQEISSRIQNSNKEGICFANCSFCQGWER